MNRRTFLKYLGIGAVGAVLGTYDFSMRGMSSVFLSHCSRMGFEPKILSVSDSVMQNLLWTRQGIGVSLVPYSAQSMLSGSHQLICKRLVEPEISTHTVVAWLKGRSLSSSCAQFINMFRDKYVKK